MSNSAYLLGFFALLVPLVLHFLNRQQAPLVRIGSIQWLKNTPIARAQESTQGFQNFWLYRFTQRRLWFLRSLILVFVVLILADVLLEMPFFEKKQQKWLLISPALAQNEKALRTLDSCQKLDYQIRWFADQFPDYSNKNFAQLSDTSKISDKSFEVNYFALLEKLYFQKNEFETAIVLLDPLQRKFRTAQQTWEINETDSAKIKIMPVLPSEKPRTELVKAYFAEPSSLYLFWVFSEPTANRFIINRLKTNLEKKLLQDSILEKVEIFQKEGNWFAKKPSEKAILIEKKQVKKIDIIHDSKNTDEAVYVQKALETVQIFAEQPLEITLKTAPYNPLSLGAGGGIIIWLSSQKVPVLADTNLVVFESKTGKVLNQKSQILEEKQEKGILLKKAEVLEKGRNVWENSEGEAILLETSPKRYVFYSRFRQDWGDFDRVLPRFFLKLLTKNEELILENDQLMIDPLQLKPVFTEEKEVEKKPEETTKSFFQQFLAFFVLILIAVERFWTQKH